MKDENFNCLLFTYFLNKYTNTTANDVNKCDTIMSSASKKSKTN